MRSLRWRHNEHDGVPNHQPLDCLFNCLFMCRSKETSKLRVIGLCAGNSPVTGEFPAQTASNAENVSVWWRHHDQIQIRHQSSSLCDFRTNKSYFTTCEEPSAIILRHGNAIASHREGIKIHNLIIPHFICVEVILGVLYMILSVVIDITRMINCSMI